MKQKFNFDHIHRMASDIPPIEQTHVEYANQTMKIFNIILNNDEATDEMIDSVDIEGIQRAFDVVNYATTCEDAIEEEEGSPDSLRESLYQHVYVRGYLEELLSMAPVQPVIKFF